MSESSCNEHLSQKSEMETQTNQALPEPIEYLQAREAAGILSRMVGFHVQPRTISDMFYREFFDPAGGTTCGDRRLMKTSYLEEAARILRLWRSRKQERTAKKGQKEAFTTASAGIDTNPLSKGDRDD